jgi:hypothetical protein
MAPRDHRPLKVIAFKAMAFGGGAMSSVKGCKIYIDVLLL